MSLSQISQLISRLMGDEDENSPYSISEEDLKRKKIRHGLPEGTILSRRILGVADPNPTFTPNPIIQNNEVFGHGMLRMEDGSVTGANNLPSDVFGGLMEQQRRDGVGPISKFVEMAFGIPAAAVSPRVFKNQKVFNDMVVDFNKKGSPIYRDVDAARAQFDAMQVERADGGRDPITRVRNKGYNSGETPAPKVNYNVPAPGQKMTPKAVSYMGVGTKTK